MKLSYSLIYNGSVLTGLGLVGAGTWRYSPPMACIVVGSLVLALTIYGAERLARLRHPGDD